MDAIENLLTHPQFNAGLYYDGFIYQRASIVSQSSVPNKGFFSMCGPIAFFGEICWTYPFLVWRERALCTPVVIVWYFLKSVHVKRSSERESPGLHNFTVVKSSVSHDNLSDFN